jgi:hypothetical protein
MPNLRPAPREQLVSLQRLKTSRSACHIIEGRNACQKAGGCQPTDSQGQSAMVEGNAAPERIRMSRRDEMHTPILRKHLLYGPPASEVTP